MTDFHIPNAIWLRRHLLTIAPETFDYFNYRLIESCGCVAYHVARHEGSLNSSKRILEQFLGISFFEAERLFVGRLLEGSAFTELTRKGQPGIDRAVRCLDEIASAHGVDLAALAREPVEAGVSDADREAAFLASVRAEARQACGVV